MHQDHIYHYIWNKNNPYQKRWIPLATIESFQNEFRKIRSARKVPKDSEKNVFKKLEKLPLLVFLGNKDTIVGNYYSKATFDHIPGQNKKLVTINGLDHMPFSHGTFKNLTMKYVLDLFQNAVKK